MAEPPPVGGQTGATSEPTTSLRLAMLSARLFQLIIGRVDAGVGQRKNKIDAIEAHAVHFGMRGQIQHGFEFNETARSLVPCLRAQATWRYGLPDACAVRSRFLDYFLPISSH